MSQYRNRKNTFMAVIVIPVVALLLAGPLLAETESDIDTINTHLTFLGYKCEKKTNEKKESLTCKTKQTIPDLHIQPKAGGFLISFYRLATEEGRKQETEMLQAINRLNADAIAARFYRDSDGDMSMEAFFPGVYEKQAFSNLLSTFNDDWKRLVKEHEEELGKLLKL
ncbi:MAG: YbjN domain-containing protein [Spirochaetia bacterium]|nr:YbjN domain-containing protein [Spirochaetia bacterium]